MIGDVVAGLTLLSALGPTRAGELFLGECADGRCAVKLLRPEVCGDRERVDRALAAAKAVGALDHRGIEFVIEAGWDGDRAYLLGDLMPGTPVAKLVARRAFEPDTASAIIHLAADALAAAHLAGVHHLALDPVLLHVGFASDRVLVRDFGLGELAPASEAYRAPEQRAAASAVGAAADVYALGCIAYELLCGVPPPVDGPAPPVRVAVPDVSSRVEELLRRMLAPDPAARPAMADVRDELAGKRRAAVGAPPAPAPPREPPRARLPDVAEVMAALAVEGSDEPTPGPGPPPEPPEPPKPADPSGGSHGSGV